MHQAPYTNKRPHCAAVAAVATFKVRGPASAWSPSKSNSLCVKIVSHDVCQGAHHIPAYSPGIVIQNKSPKGKEKEIC